MKFFRELRSDIRGATAIEYGLIAVFIAIASITAMSQLGTQVSKPLNNVRTTLGAAAT